MSGEQAQQELVCLHCERRVTVKPTLTLLGFQAFTCPSCNAAGTYPLLERYRKGYQIAIWIVGVATLVGLWVGKPLIPGLGFAVMFFALLRDRALTRAVKDSQKPRE
jgi:hypothetical protein